MNQTNCFLFPNSKYCSNKKKGNIVETVGDSSCDFMNRACKAGLLPNSVCQKAMQGCMLYSLGRTMITDDNLEDPKVNLPDEETEEDFPKPLTKNKKSNKKNLRNWRRH